jgi:hypothetical protein
LALWSTGRETSPMNKCTGECFSQSDNDENGYTQSNCPDGCQLRKCPNFELCGVLAPEWYLLCHSGRCVNCNMIFGTTLKIVRLDTPEQFRECPVCLETGKTIFAQWGCTHLICVDCLKQINYINPDTEEMNISAGKCPVCRHREFPAWKKASPPL